MGRSKGKNKKSDAVERVGVFTRLRRYFQRRPVFRFITLVTMLMALFYTLFYLPNWDKGVKASLMPGYLKAYANVTALVLRGLGHDASVTGTSVMTPRYSVRIAQECSALEPTALFLAGVIALQVRRGTRWKGILLGVLLLAVTNVIRIVSLFYVGIYKPEYFNIVHIDVWQALFVVLAIGYWALWAMWATKMPREDHVAG